MKAVEIQRIKGKNVTFVLTPSKIAVDTGLQFFILEPAEGYYFKRMRTIRILIQLGEVQSISDLSTYCNGKIQFKPYKRSWL